VPATAYIVLQFSSVELATWGLDLVTPLRGRVVTSDECPELPDAYLAAIGRDTYPEEPPC
jgi:hypothetical protein